VLFSGLFRNTAPPTSSPTARGGGGRRIPVDRQRLSFVDHSLRLRLREGLRVREARAVYEEVSRHVRESLNLSVEEFEAILKQAPSAPASQDPALLEAFAKLAPSCLRGLGRRYEQLADEIERAARQPLPSPGPTGEDLLALEGVSFATAWLEELPLQRIPFQSAVLQDGTIRRFANQCWGYAEPLAAEGHEAVPLTMVEIPAGKGLLGSPVGEPERSDNEGPQHEVHLQGFFISQAPITQAQWRAVANWQECQTERWGRRLDPNPSRFRGDQAELLPSEASSDQRPVERVTWHEAMEFCQRLSQRTGRHYTLPSEAQWEYACRAGSATPFHFGTNLVGRFRYSFAVSYPASLRPLVEPIVALMLAACNQDKRRLLYDSFQQDLFARPGLAERLAEAYLSCDCVVVFLSKDYLETATNQLEWLALKPLRDDPRDRARVLLFWCGERDDRLLATLGLDLAQDRVHWVEDLGPAAIWDLMKARCVAEGLVANKSGKPVVHRLASYDGDRSYDHGPMAVSLSQTTPVGMFPANEWGLHDTHGNVWEWCLDHWHRTYKGLPTDGSAWLQPDALSERSSKDSQASTEATRPRLLRGGSWNFDPRFCRSAHRLHYRPHAAFNHFGFRVVCLPQDASLTA
jgi:formylglycine-generating enzyme required for sulfatase activity